MRIYYRINHIFLKNTSGSGTASWVYDSGTKLYSLTIDGNVVAIIDSSGNLKITGRVLKA